MIGYILIGIGAWLLYDDHKTAKTKEHIDKIKKGGSDGIHKNGNDRGRGNSVGKPGEFHQKPDGNGRISPIPVKTGKKGVHNDVSEKPVHKVEPDKNRDSPGNNSGRKPDTASIGDQGKSLKDQSKFNKGGQDAGIEINHENGAGNDGDNVGLESSGRDESNGAKTD